MSNIEIAQQDSKLHLIGLAHCGLFGISEDYEEAYLSLDQYMMKNRESTFFFRAKGDSMTPLIMEGDILVVDASLKVKSNQIAIVHLNGERLCKRILFHQEGIILVSENPRHKRIILNEGSELSLFGVVIGIARLFI